ncbi:MAG: hypothetical protein LBL91_02485, partial [Lachnospiraceae bacterium]|nr:hypothetical protein [Lachnospiraceae bacterium]
MSKKKKVLIISILALILISILVLTAVAVYNTFYKEQENSSQVAEISNGSIFTKENMPRVDASTATQPLVTAVISNFIGEDLSDEEIDYTNTHSAYERLIAGEKDLIVVTEPS